MKTIKVVAAVIKDINENGEIVVLSTQRGYGDYKGGWEFPGGKVEAGEGYKEALIREIKEELDVDIEVNDYIDTVEYDYPSFHLSMDCFFCCLVHNDFVLKEHLAYQWLTINQLDSVDWLPADISLVKVLKTSL